MLAPDSSSYRGKFGELLDNRRNRGVHQQGTILPCIIGSIGDACHAKPVCFVVTLMTNLYDVEGTRLMNAGEDLLTLTQHRR